MTNDQANYYSGITSITVNGKNVYELKGKFLDDLHNNAFSGTNGEDAVENIEYFLKIVDPIDLPNVNQDKLRVVVFQISLPSRTGKVNTPIIKWDPTNPEFKNWLASKFVNYKMMDIFTKGALWDYWKLGSDEIEPTNEEPSDLKETDHDDEQEIDLDLLTKDIEGFKTYEEFKDDWIYKWNKDVPWVHKKPWRNYGAWKEPTPVTHCCKPFNYKTGCSKWPTYSWRNDGYCNGGNLPRAYIIGNSLHYQDYEWYGALEDGELKEEALRNKAIMKGIIDDDDESIDERQELCSNETHKLPVCNIRRFKMIKYLFGDDEEYVAVKEDEYDDLTSTSKDACRAYQEIFRMMDEGWMGGVLLGPERPRTYDDLSDNEKKQYDADVRSTNIVLQGLPKDIYKLINHNIDAKAIWDNVKMLLACSELTKEDRESQLHDEFERFKMVLGENINEYYVRFHKLVNDMRNIRLTMPNIQLNSKFVNNMSPEWHAAQDRLIIERITPTTNDQLVFVSTVQPYAQSSHVQSHQYPLSHVKSHQYPSSSAALQSPHIHQQHPQFPETSQINSGHTQTDEILENLTKQIALLAQSFRATLPRTNNQLRTSSNTRNQATIQDGRIMVQNVQGRQNQRSRKTDQDKMLLMQAQENGAVLDEEELLFLAGERANTFDADMDNQPVQDLALNKDNIFQADECDAFDSDVDDEQTAQSIFMANLSSGASQSTSCVTNQDRHEIHNEVQQANVIDSTTIDMGNSNVIPNEQYLSINNVSVVPSCASSALNDACVLFNNDAYGPHDPIATELKIYKEQVAIYEQRAKFELTEREQRMDDQMCMLIQNCNKTEENHKKELHSVKLQLNSTMENNKIIEETVTVLKQEFKQKEYKFLTDFSNLKHLNDKQIPENKKLAVVNTGKGKLDTDLKKSRWVWRPKGNYLDHVSKDSGSFMLKKVEYVDPKGISKSVMALIPKR
ncbi:hypothetical protein Tco_0971890 [Tanacetum coccineum]